MIKEEPQDQTNFVQEISFCRCCFNGLSFADSQFPADEPTMQAFQDITQMDLKPSPFLTSFCEKCFNDVVGFQRFKQLAVAKQQKFEETGDARLSSMADPLVKDEEEHQEVIVKEEIAEFEFQSVNEDFEDPPGGEEEKLEKGNKVSKFPLCPHCPVRPFRMESHIARCHSIKCQHCPFRSVHQKSLDNHIWRKHRETVEVPQEPHTCPICGRKVISLDKHIESVHKKVRNYFCDLCDYSGYLRQYIINHMKSAHLTKKIFCSACKFVTTSTAQLNRHMRKRHIKEPPGGDRAVCNECGATFKSKQYMEQHILRKHQGVKEFPCDVCGHSFFTRNELE